MESHLPEAENDAKEVLAGAFSWHDVPPRPMWEGVTLQVVGGNKLMLSMVSMAHGASIPTHSHPHEQSGIWLEGEAEFAIGERTHVVRAGDSYVIPGDTPHSVRVLEGPARALDVFAPPREDYERLRGR